MLNGKRPSGLILKTENRCATMASSRLSGQRGGIWRRKRNFVRRFLAREFFFALLGFAFVRTTLPARAQSVSLEALRRDGYGVVTVERPRANFLTVVVAIDGHRHRLLLDTGWPGDGIGLIGQAATTTSTRVAVTGSYVPLASGGSVVRLGNVELTHVPVEHAEFPELESELARRMTGADGAIGVGFLRTCSAFIDLQSLRLYLRPPGQGRRASISRAMARLGLAEIPFTLTAQDVCFVDARVNGFAGPMLLDTGAYHAAIEKRFAQKIRAHPIVTRAGFPRPRTQDEFARVTRIDEASLEARSLIENAPLTSLESLELGGVPVRAPDIRLRALHLPPGAPPGIIGSLGVDILGRNGTIIDFSEGKLYFYRKG